MWKRTSMWKRTRVGWTLFRLAARVTGDYQPPFNSVGHMIQTGRLTEQEATDYLDRTAAAFYARVAKEKLANDLAKEDRQGSEYHGGSMGPTK